MPNLLISIGLAIANLAVSIGVPAGLAIYAPYLLATYGPSLLLAGASLAVAALFRPKIDIPKPEDGRYNTKQPVPYAPIVMGLVRKAGDVLFLEEKDGQADQITCLAYHRINAIKRRWLHDEAVEVDAGGIVTLEHFEGKVRLEHRLGLDTETAYAAIVSRFPSAWTNDHRGDRVATLRMGALSVSAEDFRKVFPNQLPQPTVELEGMLIEDPRDGVTRYTENLGLMALELMRARYGFRLSPGQVDAAEFAQCAEVCDDVVTDRNNDPLPRYHGGGWFRSNTRPAEVLDVLQTSGDFRIYLKADGRIGVHPSMITDSGVHLTEDDMIAFGYVRNSMPTRNVRAVRARYTSVAHDHVTADSAIVGDVDALVDDDRTVTIELPWVQRNNHANRLQNLHLQRLQAPTIAITVPWSAGKKAMRKRFIRVTHRRRGIVNRLVEITGGGLDIRAMRVSLAGRILPDNFYTFDAATQEGVPPPVPTDVGRQGNVPPDGISLTIDVEGGLAFGDVIWDIGPDSVTYDVEYAQTSGVGVAPTGTTSRVSTGAGEEEARIGPLVDGRTYGYRVRTITPGGSVSEWSDWDYVSVTIDATAPQALSSFAATAGLGHAALTFATAAGDTHLAAIELYRVPAGVALDMDVHPKIATLGAAPGTSFGWTDGDATVSNVLPPFADAGYPTKGPAWSFVAGEAVRSSGGTTQAIGTSSSYAAGDWRWGVEIVASNGTNDLVARLDLGDDSELSSAFGGVGLHVGTLTTTGATTRFGFRSAAWYGTLADAVAYRETGACAPQGTFDYHAVPRNGSGVLGPASVAAGVTII